MLKTLLISIGISFAIVIVIAVLGLITILFSGLIKYLRELRYERNNNAK